MGVKVTDAGLANSRLQALDLGVKRGMLMAGRFLVERTKWVFRASSPKGWATGNLVRSLGITPVVFFNGAYRCRIGPSAKYGWWVHQGTGPAAGKGPRKMPPVDAIYLWIKQKGIVPKTTTAIARVPVRNSKGQFTGRRKLATITSKRKAVDIEKETRQMAFLIARKIGQKGTAPFPFLSTAYKLSKADMYKIVVSQALQSVKSGGR